MRPDLESRNHVAELIGELRQALAAVDRRRNRLELSARSAGDLSFDDTGEAVELYLNLLVGDLQIRRAIGAQKELSVAQIGARPAKALARTKQLLSALAPRQADPLGFNRDNAK